MYEPNSRSFSPENHTDILRNEVSRTYTLQFQLFLFFPLLFTLLIKKFITKIKAHKEVCNVSTNTALILHTLPF